MKRFVILHPYATSDGFRAVYSGSDAGRAATVVADYKRAGWAPHRVDAPNFHEAVVRLSARLA